MANTVFPSGTQVAHEPTVSRTTPAIAGKPMRRNQSVYMDTNGQNRAVQAEVQDLVGKAINNILTSIAGLPSIGGDLGGTAASPIVVNTHLINPLPVAQGGTGASNTAPNTVFAGPVVGTGAPLFRVLTTADLPSNLILSSPAPVVIAGQVGLGSTVGFGNGAAATPVTTTLLGTGAGPAAPQTVIGYLQINVAGTIQWIPYFT